jgi:peptide methionine sulfoxide reductase MsrA
VVTEILPFKTFFAAEEYHQNYYRRNPDDRYCNAVLVPKLKKLGLKWVKDF